MLCTFVELLHFYLSCQIYVARDVSSISLLFSWSLQSLYDIPYLISDTGNLCWSCWRIVNFTDLFQEPSVSCKDFQCCFSVSNLIDFCYYFYYFFHYHALDILCSSFSRLLKWELRLFENFTLSNIDNSCCKLFSHHCFNCFLQIMMSYFHPYSVWHFFYFPWEFLFDSWII